MTKRPSPFQVFCKDLAAHLEPDPVSQVERYTVRPTHMRKFMDGFPFMPYERVYKPKIQRSEDIGLYHIDSLVD